MFKRFLFCALLLTLGGCTSLDIPNYVADNYPYKEKFYGRFDEVLRVTKRTLEDNGWKVAKISDPSIYERSKADGKQVVIFTEIKSMPLILASRYARVNVYLRAGSDNSVEVEVRYLTVTSIPFKSFYSYRKDAWVKKFLNQVESRLVAQ